MRMLYDEAECLNEELVEERTDSSRGRDFRRRERELHIRRKECILKAYRPDNMPTSVNASDLFHYGGEKRIDRSIGECLPYWNLTSRGHLNKGKIHCSCPLCAFHGTPVQDKRNAERMAADLKEHGDAGSALVQKLERMANF